MIIFGAAGENELIEPMITLLFAIILDTCVGEIKIPFNFIKHPVVIIGSLVNFLDKKLNRDKRGELDRTIRGALCAFFIILIMGIVGYSISFLSKNHLIGWVIELFLVTSLLSGRSLYIHVKRVATGLNENLKEGRKAVSHIVGRDPTFLDKFGVARAAIESAAENLSDGVIAPIFWYIVLGFPGILMYKAINTMDSMIGYRTTKYKAFGTFAAKIDDIANFIPARLTALFIMLASCFSPTANPKKSLETIIRDSSNHRSINAGWPESAMAGALNIALAGPRRHKDSLIDDPWIGTGTAQVLAKDIDRALYVYVVANLINMVWLSAITVIKLNLT